MKRSLRAIRIPTCGDMQWARRGRGSPRLTCRVQARSHSPCGIQSLHQIRIVRPVADGSPTSCQHAGCLHGSSLTTPFGSGRRRPVSSTPCLGRPGDAPSPDPEAAIGGAGARRRDRWRAVKRSLAATVCNRSPPPVVEGGEPVALLVTLGWIGETDDQRSRCGPP